VGSAVVLALLNFWAIIRWIRRGFGLVVFLVGVGLLIYACLEPFRLEFNFNEIRVTKSFRPFTAVHLSDLHVQWPYPYVTEARMERVIAKINDLHPDIIFITGDMTSRSYSKTACHRSVEAVGRILSRLHTGIPKFAVLGNNDFHLPGKLTAEYEKYGIKLLRNEQITLNSEITITGIDSVSGAKNLTDPSRVFATFTDRKAPLRILLAHEPDVAFQASDSRLFDLQLSGHTHGGQVIVPFGIGPLILPTFGRKVPIGLHKIGDLIVFVSKGIGISPLPKPPVRFNCRPEVAVLRIVPSE
jgi:predicted MPP superfamily phosphohydrolase